MGAPKAEVGGLGKLFVSEYLETDKLSFLLIWLGCVAPQWLPLYQISINLGDAGDMPGTLWHGISQKRFV